MTSLITELKNLPNYVDSMEAKIRLTKLEKAGYNPNALRDQITILKETEKLESKIAFDRPYINHYIMTELTRLNYVNRQISNDFKVLEFFGNDQRWFEDSDLITHPDEVNDEYYAAKGNKVVLDLDNYNTCQEIIIYENKWMNKYDLIICPQVLCYSIDPLNMLSTLYLMLKKNGHIIITTNAPCFVDYKDFGFTLFYTLDGLKKIVGKVFQDKNIENTKSYGNLEQVMRTLAFRNCANLTEKDFEEHEKGISITVAATARK